MLLLGSVGDLRRVAGVLAMEVGCFGKGSGACGGGLKAGLISGQWLRQVFVVEFSAGGGREG